nr:hypothetical protein [Tanacetum cinerariifolium]
GRGSGSGVKEKKDGVGDDSMDNCGMKSVPVTPNATSSVDDMSIMHVNKSGDHASPLISFANLVKGDSRCKAMNFRPLFTLTVNEVNVYVSKESVSVVNERLNKTLYSYTAVMCTDSWERASYARAMVELRADVELTYTIVVALPKFSSFCHALDEYPKKIVSDISKNSKMTHQPTIGPTMGLKPKSTFVYHTISTKKATKANGNSRGRGNQISSTNATHMVARINDLERQMVDGC